MKTIGTVEAAEYLGIHPVSVGDYIRKGRLRATRDGWKYRIRIKDLRKFADNMRPVGRPKKSK
jgi:excisionase family DNA binding protein